MDPPFFNGVCLSGWLLSTCRLRCNQSSSTIGTAQACAAAAAVKFDLKCVGQAILALARLDSDAVWLSLTRVAAQDPTYACTAAALRRAPSPPANHRPITGEAGSPGTRAPKPDSTTGPSQDTATACAGHHAAFGGSGPPPFPSFRQLCPGMQALTHGGLPAGQVAQAQKLLKLVEGVRPAWHDQLDLACP